MADDWHIREVAWPIDPPAAVQWYAGDSELAWLDSAAQQTGDGLAARYSLIACRPLARVEQFDGRKARFVVIEGGPTATDRLGREGSPPVGERVVSCAGPAAGQRIGAAREPAAGDSDIGEGGPSGNARLPSGYRPPRGERIVAEDANGLRLWRRVAARLPRLARLPCGLTPGWVGYIGFEMAAQLERLPRSHAEDLGLPLLRMALFDRAIILDHEQHRAFAVAAPGVREGLRVVVEARDWQRYRGSTNLKAEISDSGPAEAESAMSAESVNAPLDDSPLDNPRIDDARLDDRPLDDSRSDGEWIERWQRAATARAIARPPRVARLRAELQPAEYQRMVRRALEYIAAGDIYQVNLAQRLLLDGVGDAFELYRAVRRTNPAPYAALLRWGDGAIASASPELFLRLRGDEVRTSPIKGTRPRAYDEELDAIRRRELLESAKDAAELTMIIDLHRNDLGRVCAYGSVRVAAARRLEAHPSVFHTVADVVGRLRPECDAFDLLAACFPAGSVTGVPKIRAMQIIDELEPAARGAYTGAIGALGLDGQMTLNVAIRTVQVHCGPTTHDGVLGGRAVLHVGGGIVAESDPRAEYDETLAKGRGILDALQVARREVRV